MSEANTALFAAEIGALNVLHNTGDKLHQTVKGGNNRLILKRLFLIRKTRWVKDGGSYRVLEPKAVQKGIFRRQVLQAYRERARGKAGNGKGSA